MKIVSKSDKETFKIGKILAEEIIKGKEKAVIALRGELGSGKTTFVQGMADGFGIREKITSPTFVIFKRYEIPKLKNGNYKWFYHLDCYRLNGPNDLKELGLKEILEDNQNIVAIEWAERIEEVLPKETAWLEFEHLEENRREIRIKE